VLDSITAPRVMPSLRLAHMSSCSRLIGGNLSSPPQKWTNGSESQVAFIQPHTLPGDSVIWIPENNTASGEFRPESAGEK